jgi:hydrogenase maturation protein HypF
MTSACAIRVLGVVQGVGFRPFVLRLARANTLAGWVRNGDDGVEIHVEGADTALHAFVRGLREQPPPAARITAIDVQRDELAGVADFTIRESRRRDTGDRPTTRIATDLPVCEDCLRELFDPADRRFGYPYINCTNCGPRYTVIRGLPYDRPRTTMAAWPLDAACRAEYEDPEDRRFHAQPVACAACGPAFALHSLASAIDSVGAGVSVSARGGVSAGGGVSASGLGSAIDRASAGRSDNGECVRGSDASIRRAAALLAEGRILAVKGLGGYHLACDASNAQAVSSLRERKFRKEKPFALMARDPATARTLVELSVASEALLTSSARPIVLAPTARAIQGVDLAGVAPGLDELGVMLPYTPVHHLLFAYGAPAVLVMTSANRSSEPIAYEDDDARERLGGIADAILIGERPIARRMDDSVARAGTFGPVVLRRARGYAPEAVTTLPATLPAAGPAGRPMLAVGADLKSAVTLVVDGQAFVSQHIGDLEHAEALRAFRETIVDLVAMYDVPWADLLVVHDAHPEYASTQHALALPARSTHAVQHHRAHVASVLAEREAWDTRVLGVSCDGTGYGDDGTIWGGELFTGSIAAGFDRVAHLRRAALPGGDAAARHPVQAAAGFLAELDDLPDLRDSPFAFPERYTQARQLIRREVRTFTTSSIGRLFDAAAALLGFARPITFEGQPAIWLEQLARRAAIAAPYPFPFDGRELDFRPLLRALIHDRRHGVDPEIAARAFQRGIACGLGAAVTTLCRIHRLDTVVLSGGVFQNELLLEDLRDLLDATGLRIWTNHRVPPNDGGISLGQAAIGAFLATAAAGN